MASPILDDDTRRFGRLMHYAGLLVVVLCASLGYSWGYAPVVQSIADTETRMHELMLSVQNGPAIHTHHRQVAAELEGVHRRIAQVRQRVPQSADAGEFLKDLTQIAGDEQLALKNFRPEKPASRGGYEELEVTLAGEGNFAAICTFFDRLAKLQRLSKVKSMKLTASNSTEQYPLETTLIIYFGLHGKEADVGKEANRG